MGPRTGILCGACFMALVVAACGQHPPQRGHGKLIANQRAQRGLKAFRRGDFQLAVLRLREAIAEDPENKQVKNMLGRLPSVVDLIPKAVGDDEFNLSVRKGAIAYVDGRDLESAVNALRYAHNRKPKDEKLLAFLNVVEKEAGKPVSRLGPNPMGGSIDQKLYDARQAIYDGDYDLAILRTQENLEVEPYNVTALEIQGTAHYLKGEKEKAKAVWQRVLELDPDNKVVREFIGKLSE
ncbi:tetratricopeptide repeat protein [Elusimicrobiota bacterium]